MGVRLGTARARVVVGDWVGSLPAGVVVQLALDRRFSRRGGLGRNSAEQRFPREGVSRGNASEQRFPRRGSLGETPRSNVSPRRGSLGEMPRKRFPTGGGLSGKRLGATFLPEGGGVSGETPAEQRFSQEGVSRGNAAERYPSPARGGPGGAGKCAEAQFVSGEARSAGGDTILRRPDKG